MGRNLQRRIFLQNGFIARLTFAHFTQEIFSHALPLVYKKSGSFPSPSSRYLNMMIILNMCYLGFSIFSFSKRFHSSIFSCHCNGIWVQVRSCFRGGDFSFLEGGKGGPGAGLNFPSPSPVSWSPINSRVFCGTTTSSYQFAIFVQEFCSII